MRPVILIADDDPTIRANLATLLSSEGFAVHQAEDGRQAVEMLAAPDVNLALLDLKMPELDGLGVLRECQHDLEETPVIVITAFGGSQWAIEAMKLGAFDYITKPFDLDEVLFTVRRALTQQALVAQVRAMEIEREDDLGGVLEEELVGRSSGMIEVFKTVGRVAATREPVLILGESGTGKELVANAIHRNSPRADRPFIKVNCAALSPTLLESELFGHERGAFTGAVAQRIGRFEQADGGTLFLDEIGDLDVALQAKLLRVVQTGRFERVGGSQTVEADVRIVSATHRDLPGMIAEDKFREDLWYRLNVVTVELPALRDRRDDVPLIAEHIVSRLAKKYDWPRLALSPEAVDWLREQAWPGNVRELQNVLTRATALARGRLILPSDLVPNSRVSGAPATAPADATGGLQLKEILAETERRVIAQALQQTDWNRTKAARELGISRRQLFDKIRQYDLRPRE
ncbi:MAG TPA: sigma-54 dependent transcriptional regulator [Pirellulales bacterium]|nr:sigma-54 dependent transcriptional regulator [Pirellulales bacterium]